MLIIEVWYGHEQQFGKLGNPQTAVNILGNVQPAKHVTKMFYELNGEFSCKLSIGPDFRRLANPGDFNVEIDTNDLIEGINTLVITAVDRMDRQTTSEVKIQYFTGNRWPKNYTVDWHRVKCISDAAQIIDGLWGLENGSIRTLETGYDRVISLGDITWRDYEVAVPIKIHGYDRRGIRPKSVGFNLGIVLRWQGHTDWDGSQPRYGYFPHGAMGIYEYNMDRDPRSFHLKLYGNQVKTLTEQNSCMQLKIGICYIFKMRVQSRTDMTAYYLLKVWEADLPEPEHWDLEGSGFIGEHDTGSILLLAHHTDVSFGNITIASIG